MSKEQVFMGAVVALLCGAVLLKERWFLAETKKGQWLVRRCGQQRAVWLLRAVFGGGAVFGVLLACDWIRPIHW